MAMSQKERQLVNLLARLAVKDNPDKAAEIHKRLSRVEREAQFRGVKIENKEKE